MGKKEALSLPVYWDSNDEVHAELENCYGRVAPEIYEDICFLRNLIPSLAVFTKAPPIESSSRR